MMTPDPQRQAFLDKIIAEPHDDVHRLVYADWIRDRGESELAEIIHLFLDHNFMYGHIVPCDLCERREQLLKDHSPPDLTVNGNHVYWDKGFITKITCTWPDWNAHADEIVEQHPIEEVRLLTWPEVEFLGTDDGVKYWFSNRPDQFIISDVTERARKTRARLFKLNWPTVGKFILPDGWDQVAHHEATHTILPLDDNPPMQYYPPSP